MKSLYLERTILVLVQKQVAPADEFFQVASYWSSVIKADAELSFFLGVCSPSDCAVAERAVCCFCQW